MRHLIYSVEDDENIRFIIEKTLKNVGYDVATFENGQELFEALEHQIPSMILLDIMLPKMSGLEILKTLKEKEAYKRITTIIISAKDSEMDKVNGLDLGADDYIAKPFGILELVSRINAHARRLAPKETILTLNDITLNVDARTCMKGGQSIPLTLKEFDLLCYFIENKNKALKREDILNHVWGYDYIGESRTLDMHIKTLRAKLGLQKEDRLIESIRSIGYKINEE